MKPAFAKARFTLTLQSTPSDDIAPEVCELLYGMREKNLIASLSTMPYLVGRTFSLDESIFFHDQLKRLGVGHSLISNDPNVESISYSPDYSSSDSLAPSSQGIPAPASVSKMSPTIKRISKIVIFAISLLGAYGVLNLPKTVYTEKKTSSQNESVLFAAKIVKIVDHVEYRAHQDITWKNAELDIRLNSGDSIRTFDESTAHLKYREGSLVIVRPKTLMVIGREEAARQTISLEDGHVQARLKSSETPRTLSIITPIGTLDMQSPTEGGAETEARVDTSVTSGKVEIAVTSGKANLIPTSPDLKPIELTKNQKINASGQTLSPIAEYVPTVQLYRPRPDENIAVNPQTNESIIFEWEHIADDAEYTFEIFTAEDGSESLLKRQTNEARLELTFLDLGTLYWRITAKSHLTTFVSDIRRLHVKKRND